MLTEEQITEAAIATVEMRRVLRHKNPEVAAQAIKGFVAMTIRFAQPDLAAGKKALAELMAEVDEMKKMFEEPLARPN